MSNTPPAGATRDRAAHLRNVIQSLVNQIVAAIPPSVVVDDFFDLFDAIYFDDRCSAVANGEAYQALDRLHERSVHVHDLTMIEFLWTLDIEMPTRSPPHGVSP